MFKFIVSVVLLVISNLAYAGNEYTSQYGVSKIIPANVVFPDFKNGGLLKNTEPTAELSVVLASTNDIKKEATKDFFSKSPIFKQNKINLLTVKADSDIAEQPIGIKSAILGATNRIESAKKIRSQQGLESTPNTYYIAIENFFSKLPATGKPTDHALLIIETPDGKQHIYLSAGVEICRDIYNIVVTPQNITQDKTGTKSTIGQYLAFKYRVNKSDWFSYVLDKPYSRLQQIATAFQQTGA